MGRAMVAQYCASFRQVPRRITLDIDEIFDAVHGGQQMRLFNAYYDEYGINRDQLRAIQRGARSHQPGSDRPILVAPLLAIMARYLCARGMRLMVSFQACRPAHLLEAVG